MSLSRWVLFVLALGFSTGGRAAAQQPVGQPYIPPGTRGYRSTMMIQNYWQRSAQSAVPVPRVMTRYQAPAAPEPAAAPPLQVVITAPPEQSAQYAYVRGPDGQVRRFPLARAARVVQPQAIVVRPGESVTLRFLAAAPTPPKK